MQKTAYVMRISDWSSDVCSSDLENQHGAAALAGPPGFGHIHGITPHILSLSGQSASVSIGAAVSGAGSPRSARWSASRSSAISQPATTLAASALPLHLVHARH